MTKAKFIFIALLVFVGALCALLLYNPKVERPDTLVAYVAMGMKQPLEEIARKYEKEYGVAIEFQFEGSGALLGKLELSPEADLYLAADEFYLDIAREKGLAREKLDVSRLTGVLAVASGNPKDVKSLNDLITRDDLRIGIANPEAAAVGKFSKNVLEENALWNALEPKISVLKPTVEALAMDLVVGSLDVAIIWDATAKLHDEIEAVRVPEFEERKQKITVGILESADDPTAALHFARYLTARDRGLLTFEKMGFETITGDVWRDQPEILFFSGAMLRPAIDKRIDEFEKREGVTINPVYNGCGILVSQMNAGANPDAYFSCDVSFMDMVKDRFTHSVVVAGNDIILLVKKGKENEIQSLNDLSKPDVSVGVAHETDSALGKLTQILFEKAGVYNAIYDSGNVKLASATGDLLINQIRGGALDVVVVYRSNALAHPDTLDDAVIVPINHPAAHAVQPFAVADNSPHAHTMNRLFDYLVSTESRKEFQAKGFDWEMESTP